MKRIVRLLSIAVALGLGVVSSAQATSTNLVPNPGFEADCGESPPVPCDWQSPAGVTIIHDFSNPHGGTASLQVGTTEDTGSSCVSEEPGVCAWASTYGSCVTAGDGAFSASFWYRTTDPAIQYVGLWSVLWSQPNCTGLGPAYLLSTPAIADGAWHRVTGTFADYFPGTQSGYFTVFAGCDWCTDDITASFDDVEVATPGDDTTPPETTIISGPSGSTSSTSATFEFAANEPSTFTCSLDGQPFTWCESPTTYYGRSEDSHAFRVRATDASANTDPTPAERSWLVTTNPPPTAAFVVSCSGLSCTFDGQPLERRPRDRRLRLALRRRDDGQRTDGRARLRVPRHLHSHADGDGRPGRRRRRVKDIRADHAHRDGLHGEGPAEGRPCLDRIV